MFDLIVLGVTSVAAWFSGGQSAQSVLQPLELLAWEEAEVFSAPEFEHDRLSQSVIDNYLQQLSQSGYKSDRQGLWIQSGWDVAASNLGNIPLPAASLTKIATTLAALDRWGARHQFLTNVYVTGEIVNGVVKGDLVVEGNGDPLFVWEEAIALGNTLNQLGVKEVQGNILVTDKFYMNFEQESLKSGKLLQQALNYRLWHSAITQQYLRLPIGTKKPKVLVRGEVKVTEGVPLNAQVLIHHSSLPLAEILRQMNIYSNNKMAQILTDLLGGANLVAETSAELASFPGAEIMLINGSGLGEANQISPRAVCQMLMATERLLKPYKYSVTDLFPTAGKDIVGTLQGRNLPAGTAIKTGTLDRVSALAGVIPTGDRSNVCFSVINYGRPVQYLRQQQDSLLNELVQPWQLEPNDFNLSQERKWYFGNPQRNKTSKIN
ncbi:MAG: D-alanyl-D-alanine carboxypeptidase [Cyanobacteria bacterium P01_C01_bin.72]